MSGAIGEVGRAARRELLLSPFIWATLIGLVLALADVRLPGPVQTLVGLLAGAAAPTALVALGLFMAQSQGSLFSALPSLVTTGKLVVHPALTAAMAATLALSPEKQTIAVLMASMPPAVASFLMAERYRVGEEDAAATIVLATAASVATIPLVALIFT